MNNINSVIQRMNTIEQRFNHSRQLPSTVQIFSDELRNAEKSVSHAAVNGDDITKMIKHSAVKYGIDPGLALAVANAESSLNPDATSPVGASGVMQLMPETAKSLGVNNVYDPKENIEGGVRYLKQMLTSFNGDLTKALAAYNAGPEAVKKYGGVPPYQETQEYVAKILASYKG